MGYNWLTMMNSLPSPPSPPWSKSSKRLVTSILIVLSLLLVYWIRRLLIYVLVAMIVAYIVHPVVNFIYRRTPLPRLAAIALVYLVIVAGLVAIPVTTVPQVIAQFNTLINNMPRYMEQTGSLLDEPVSIGDYSFTLTELPVLEQALSTVSEDLVGVAQQVGSRSFSLFGSLATATLSTVAWLLVVLFLSFYMVKDHHMLFNAVLQFVPKAYRADIYRLGSEISATWNAFLRGQLILFTIMSITVFTLATFIGLPNALLLGLISGLAEFIPQLGATLAMIPALLVAFFQSDASWLGQQMSPFWFMILIMIAYVLLQQIENYFLVPRVIGRQLSLHPLVVFVAALAGASAAGILGILVAAPLLASGRLIFRYLYCKLMDLPPFPTPPFSTAVGQQAAIEAPRQELLFRPAKMEDEAAVAAVAAQIWDGGDYVADCFADWVADPYGQFTVVYEGDELVAFSKLTRLGSGEWWLEGLRVSPKHRRRGFARQLHNYAVDLADQVGSGVLRFATSAANRAVHRIAQDSGFRLVSSHLLAEASALPSSDPLPFLPVDPSEAHLLLDWLNHSPIYKKVEGLAEDDWIWQEIEPRLADWLAAGQAYWWLNTSGEESGVVLIRCSERETIWLNYFDIPDIELPAAAIALRRLTGLLGGNEIKGKPLAIPEMRIALSNADWQVAEEEMWVFERPIKSKPGIPRAGEPAIAHGDEQ